jgi:hypothetical protein
MSNQDDFLERLRGHTSELRYQVDDATLARIRARIHERIARPTVTELLAAWFRPLVATAAAIALAAAIGIATLQNSVQNGGQNSDPGFGESPFEITMGGETYRVGE